MISLHTLTEMQNALGCKQALHCGMPLTFLYVYTKNTGISVPNPKYLPKFCVENHRFQPLLI